MQGFYNNIIDNIIAIRIAIAFTVSAIVFIIGSFGYHFVEVMEFFNGFYMTFITISTIGLSELTNLSSAGRVLTMVIFMMGIAHCIAEVLQEANIPTVVVENRASSSERIKHLREEGCENYCTLKQRVWKHDFMKHINSHQSTTQSA